MKLYHAAWRPLRPDWDTDIPYQSFFLMDDQILIEPDVGLRAHVSLELSEEGPVRALGE